MILKQWTVEMFLLHSDVCTLRERHRIVGTLVGCLPRLPRQNGHLGVPLQLMNEEASLLLETGENFGWNLYCKYLASSFYLFDPCVTPYSGICYFYNGGQHCGVRKLASVWGATQVAARPSHQSNRIAERLQGCFTAIVRLQSKPWRPRIRSLTLERVIRFRLGTFY